LLGWRRISNATNERTVVTAAFPVTAVSESLPIVFSGILDAGTRRWLEAETASFVHDFIGRMKMGGSNLNLFLIKQLPIHRPEDLLREDPAGAFETALGWIQSRVERLTLEAGVSSSSEVERFNVRCQLDAYFFLLYGISRADVEYVMESFPIVRRKDEEQYGEYLTKHRILEEYDRLADSFGPENNVRVSLGSTEG
jgi:hypothetical protein